MKLECAMRSRERKGALLLAAILFVASAFAQPSIVNAVRARIAQHDLAGAESLARAFQAQAGPQPQLAAAYSWLARAALAENNLDRADAFAEEASKMTVGFLPGRKLDADPWLPTAEGAAIEVHAQVLVARGQRAEAVQYLQEQARQWASTSLGERIHKNINLISMEGKRAPALEVSQWIDGDRPPALASLRGHPVLLFFWAHWCGDCKGMVADLATIRQTFGPKGLVVIGPTRLYGYVGGGEDAPPEKEKAYIEQVWEKFYASLSGVPVPLSSANFVTYGASTTPTLVLIDAAGVVRFYHPGAVAGPELAAKVRPLLAK
jgi:thiol-disulfide isomerase/thioredoxin